MQEANWAFTQINIIYPFNTGFKLLLSPMLASLIISAIIFPYFATLKHSIQKPHIFSKDFDVALQFKSIFIGHHVCDCKLINSS